MQTYILLTTEKYARQLAQSIAYFYFMVINIMVIIMNMIHYIYKHDKLKYGVSIDSSLTDTHY